MRSSLKSANSQKYQAILPLKRFDVTDNKQAFRNKYGTEEKKKENFLQRQFTSQLNKTMTRKNQMRHSSFDFSTPQSRKYKTINQYLIIKQDVIGIGAQSKVILA